MGKTGIAISAIALGGLAIGSFVLLRRRRNRPA
jgi:LPXTG-motif cell wall-anchored protein